MQHYTLITKTGKCPVWLDDVTITAKYRYSDDQNNPYLARFVCAECEIVQNIHLPRNKRNPALILYTFCGKTDCPLLSDFPPEIDVRKP